jgi:hypothetical protein
VVLRFPKETIGLKNITVRDFEELRVAIGALKDNHIFVLVNGTYNRVNAESWTPLLEASKSGSGNVQLKVSSEDITPTTSPIKNEAELNIVRMDVPLPPHFTQDKLNEIHYTQMPVAWSDQTTEVLTRVIVSDPDPDKHIFILMGPPGTGKSFSVKRACRLVADCAYLRVKVGGDHQQSVIDILSKVNPADSYDGCITLCSNLLAGVFDSLISPLVSSAWAAVKAKSRRIVIHVDDIQGLMTGRAVTRFDEVRGQLRDYAFIAFCYKIDEAFGVFGDSIRVVMSGTNFYAEVCLNVGSLLKSTRKPVDGVFPVAWLSAVVVYPYFSRYCQFQLSDYEAEIHDVLFDVSYNRRCTHRALLELQGFLQDKQEVAWKDFRRFLSASVEHAYLWWAGKLATCLGTGISNAAAKTLSFLLFPDQYGGRLDSESAEYWFDEVDVPPQVLHFALDGPIHCVVEGRRVRIRPPRGVVKRMLLEESRSCVTRNNMQQLNAFHVVSESNHTDVGHWFERALCCELSLLQSPIHEIIANKTGRRLSFNSRLTGRDFRYSPRIHCETVAALSCSIFCVVEDPKYVGQRLVDVGYSLYDGDLERYVRVFFECKDVRDPNKLLRMGERYLANDSLVPEDHRCDNEEYICVYLSRQSFMAHEPRPRVASSTKSSAAAKADIDTILATKSRSKVVIEGHELKSAILLSDLFGTHCSVSEYCGSATYSNTTPDRSSGLLQATPEEANQILVNSLCTTPGAQDSSSLFKGGEVR